MTTLQHIRERSAILSVLVRLQNSVAYPILFAALCFWSGISPKAVYIPVFWLLCATVVFAALFNPDNKVFLVPMFLIYYGIGQDIRPTYNEQTGNVYDSFAPDGLLHICISGGVMIAAFLIRLAADGTLLRVLRRRGFCTYGILAMDVAFLLGGLFAEHWVPMNLLYGAFLAMGITAAYLLVLSMLDSSVCPIPYACKTLVCASWMVLGQFSVQLFRAWRSDLLWIHVPNSTPILRRDMFQLSWGIATIMGAVLVLGIPAAMYLAKNARFAWLSYLSAAAFLGGTLIINARGALVVGCIMFLVGTVICCIRGTQKKTVLACAAGLLILGAVALFCVHRYVTPIPVLLERLLPILRLQNITDGGRFALWENGWKDFLASPVFGAGFWDGAYEQVRQMDHLYSSMYHNIFVEFLGALGLVGLISFLLHLRQVSELLIRNFSADKLLLLCPPLMILAMSLLDNFFFYLNFQIAYAAFLALAEHHWEQIRKERLHARLIRKKREKPRVVFTYVEAGKGHIIPEQAVCRRFQEKYGNRAEVVESHFYTETGDPRLAATENLFAWAVRQQNKTYLWSILCRMGNAVGGDYFTQYFLMKLTKSGLRAHKRARAHMEALDADVLFTTHWGTVFCANELKKNAPYTVCLCPDPYSNSMFRSDVNQLWIPSPQGVARAERLRAYGGGNVRAVPFPIREEAHAWVGQRSDARRTLGIAEGAFTVLLSDGGYGMASMERILAALQDMNAPVTVIALCGTNHALYERLCRHTDGQTQILPVSYTESVFPYLAASDLFCGKCGANSMAEAAYFRVPILITRCITYIERNTKNYYLRYVGGACYEPHPTRAARKIAAFAKDPSSLPSYQSQPNESADALADLLWEAVRQLQTENRQEPCDSAFARM